MKSNLTNCYIKIREGEDTPILEEIPNTGGFYINMNRYLIVPIETPIKEIEEILTEYYTNYGKEE